MSGFVDFGEGVEMSVPGSLLPEAMRRVRAEPRRTRDVPVPSEPGPAFVTDHVVTVALREALDAWGGLVVSSCRLDLDDPAGLAVRVEAWGRYPDDLAAAADRARGLVVATLGAQFALSAPGGIDVGVVDLMDPDGADEPAAPDEQDEPDEAAEPGEPVETTGRTAGSA